MFKISIDAPCAIQEDEGMNASIGRDNSSAVLKHPSPHLSGSEWTSVAGIDHSFLECQHLPYAIHELRDIFGP